MEEAQEGSEDPTDLKTEAKRRRSALLEEGAAALREDDEAEVRRCRVGLRELFNDQAWELSFPDATKAFRFDAGLSLGDVESASPTRLKNLLGQVQKRLQGSRQVCVRPACEGFLDYGAGVYPSKTRDLSHVA